MEIVNKFAYLGVKIDKKGGGYVGSRMVQGRKVRHAINILKKGRDLNIDAVWALLEGAGEF